MKKITQQQLDSITNLIFSLKCPCDAWEQYKKLLSELPEVEVIKPEEAKEEAK